MEYLLEHPWILFSITWGWMLLMMLIMNQQAKHFYTLDVVLRKFSIFQLEFPSTPEELSTLISGIYKLPADLRDRSLKALRGQLWVDFLYMPGVYLSIHVLCHQMAMKATDPERSIFMWLAMAQGIAWICDIIENIYLLNKIREDVKPSGKGAHRAYQVLEFVKWSIALTGATLGLSALAYDWLTGNFTMSSLHALGIIVLITLGYAGIGWLLNRKKEEVPHIGEVAADAK